MFISFSRPFVPIFHSFHVSYLGTFFQSPFQMELFDAGLLQYTPGKKLIRKLRTDMNGVVIMLYSKSRCVSNCVQIFRDPLTLQEKRNNDDKT
jgi:hypothetical protein